MIYKRKYGYFTENDIQIRLKDCKKGYLYKIDCRNLELGVFNGETGFIGIRTKFGNRYLFTEYHWDQGAPFGTVNPMEEIEKCPLELNYDNSNIQIENDTNLFKYLDTKLQELELPKEPKRPSPFKVRTKLPD